MTQTPAKLPAASPSPRRASRGPAWLVATIVLLLGGTLWGYYLYYPSQLGPEQPIPFSHRFHVGEKHLSCVFCHTGVMTTERAGVPPVQTCMLCHSRVIITHPEIVKLREHYERHEPIEWARVNALPEFVYFNHAAHIQRGFDCGHCHGDVAGMDRLAPSPELLMGFCVQCHRDNNYSHDCVTCHR